MLLDQHDVSIKVNGHMVEAMMSFIYTECFTKVLGEVPTNHFRELLTLSTLEPAAIIVPDSPTITRTFACFFKKCLDRVR